MSRARRRLLSSGDFSCLLFLRWPDVEIARFSSTDVAWYACTKTEAEGSVGDVARRIVSLLGLASLLRLGPSLSLPSDTVCAEGFSRPGYTRMFLFCFLRRAHVIIVCYRDLELV